MLNIDKLLPQGAGLSAVLLKRAATVQLDWDVRQKSRFDATDSAGRALGIFLPRGTVVRGGDVLVAQDGSLIRVEAAPQPVLVVTHCTEHGRPFDLIRAAYHLGNRHVQLELQPDRLKLEPDHVLAEMLSQMHLIVREAVEAFEPEGGAYAAGGSAHAGHGHGHAHSHSCDHGHGHGHPQDSASGPSPAPEAQTPSAPARGKPIAIPIKSAATTPHVHGPGCNHGHDDHGHSH